MKYVLVTGSCGLVGSEAVYFFAQKGYQLVGIDNNMRRYFFGEDGSIEWNKKRLLLELPTQYRHYDLDIRNREALTDIFKEFGRTLQLIIHTAAQPSHDWAAKEPHTDYTINANGTLNLLELSRQYCPEAVFIFTSTNKVYGDIPNQLPFVEQGRRFEIDSHHPYFKGIREDMSIDQNLHSLFGASKLAADIMVQEYGHYFNLPTVSFRCSCLTGPKQSGAQLHGFLSYLMKCAVWGIEYSIKGYQGKQVRDNLHSADLIAAFDLFFQNPRPGEVYNIGGGRLNSCSLLEAVEMSETLTEKKIPWKYCEKNRIGDHIWYITDNTKFMTHYPEWKVSRTLDEILRELADHFQVSKKGITARE